MIDFLNNREIAILIWTAVGFAWCVWRRDIRDSLKGVWRAFWRHQIIVTLAIAVIYVAACCLLMSKVYLWDASQIKNTIVWLAGSILTIFSAHEDRSNDQTFAKKMALSQFRVIAVVEFIVAFHVLPLWGELLLIPVATFLALMHSYAEGREEFKIAHSVISFLLSTLGVFVFGYSGFYIYEHFSEFAQDKTLVDFIVPPILSVLFIPFLVILRIYTVYNRKFIRFNWAFSDPVLRSYAKRRGLLAFHVRTALLERWAMKVAATKPSTKPGIDRSVEEVLKIWRKEQNPESLPLEKGWSPQIASGFLAERELETSNYRPDTFYDGIWWTEAIMELNREILPDTLRYVVEGTEDIATDLRLTLFSNHQDAAEESYDQFVATASQLYQRAMGRDLPQEVFTALKQRKAISGWFNGKFVRTTTEQFPRASEYRFAVRNYEKSATELAAEGADLSAMKAID